MNWLLPASTATDIGTAIVFAAFWYVYSRYRQRFMLIWATAWSFAFLRYTCMVVSLSWRPSVLLDIGYYGGALLYAILILMGSFLFLNHRVPRWPVVLAGGILLWICIAVPLELPLLWLQSPVLFFSAFANIFTGYGFVRARGRREGPLPTIVGSVFIVLGLHQADYPFVRPIVWLAPYGYLFGSLCAITIAVGILMLYFERAYQESLDRAKALAESEEDFRSLIESAPEAIFVQSQGRLVYLNPPMLKLLGADRPEDLLGKEFMPYVAPEFHEAVRQRIRLQRETGRSAPLMEQEYLRLDGSRVPVETTAVEIRYQDSDAHLVFVRDITERKRAEKALGESEARFQWLFERAPVAISISRGGTTILVNRKFIDLYGFQSIEEVVGLSIFDQWAPGSRETIRKYAQERARGEPIPAEYEGTGQRKDGTQFPVHIVVQSVELPEGPAVMAFLSDITERKRAEEELLKEKQLFETLFQNIPGVAYLIGEDGRFARWSHSYEQIVGYTPEQMARITVLETVAPSDRERVGRVIEETFRHGAGEVELLTLRADGKQTPSYCIGTLIRIEGKPHILGVGIDITDRKRAEEELQRVKNYLANIIDSMPSILVGMDNQEVITQWNKQAEKATGIATAQAVGQPLQTVLPDFSPWIEPLRAEIQQRRPASLEKLLLVHGEDRHFYDLVLYPLVANRVEGAVVRIEDVTERARIQELMVQTEKMLSVGGLAAGMAHEINNPLGIISQATQNIERRISSELPANHQVAEQIGVRLESVQDYLAKREIPQFLADVRQASSRAAKIVSNMLQFSRKSEAVRQPVPLADILERSLELAASDYDLKKRYDFRSIEIIRQYDPDLPAVPVVVVEMEQVLLNLVKNAAQAMADNLPERKARITLRLKREDRYAVIEVEDNGPGMEEAVRRRVFEPFFTTKEPGVGTGLGLSVSYMIITQNHKGLISVQSAPGQGTRFSIRLPLAQEA